MTNGSVVKTRFAPSPTGDLHIGGVRTALFAWLYARHHNGDFVLRIEDTDRERSTPEAVQVILDGMKYLGLDYDEGPFYQTERMNRYREVIEDLLFQGKAYRCYCSTERLQQLREKQMADKQKPRYDGHCRDHQPDESGERYVVRFKQPQSGSVVFDDMIRGHIEVQNAELDDLIIQRSDGMPTYNFSVVVDDWDMGITQVIRGDDHINNTPRQINIFQALDVEPPQYAHVPSILGENGKKLSKRHGAASVLQYKNEGFLPQALLNYLVRLGWSHGDQELFTVAEMIKHFDMTHVQRSPAALNPDKLQWLNQHYMKQLSLEELTAGLSKALQDLGLNIADGPDVAEVVPLQLERSITFVDMAERSRYFYEAVDGYDPKAEKKHMNEQSLAILQQLKTELSRLSEWQVENLHAVIHQVAEQLQLKLGKVAQPLRVALTGSTISPPIDQTLYVMGKEKVLERLEKAISFIETADKVV